MVHDDDYFGNLLGKNLSLLVQSFHRYARWKKRYSGDILQRHEQEINKMQAYTDTFTNFHNTNNSRKRNRNIEINREESILNFTDYVSDMDKEATFENWRSFCNFDYKTVVIALINELDVEIIANYSRNIFEDLKYAHIDIIDQDQDDNTSKKYDQDTIQLLREQFHEHLDAESNILDKMIFDAINPTSPSATARLTPLQPIDFIMFINNLHSTVEQSLKDIIQYDWLTDEYLVPIFRLCMPTHYQECFDVNMNSISDLDINTSTYSDTKFCKAYSETCEIIIDSVNHHYKTLQDVSGEIGEYRVNEFRTKILGLFHIFKEYVGGLNKFVSDKNDSKYKVDRITAIEKLLNFVHLMDKFVDDSYWRSDLVYDEMLTEFQPMMDINIIRNIVYRNFYNIENNSIKFYQTDNENIIKKRVEFEEDAIMIAYRALQKLDNEVSRGRTGNVIVEYLSIIIKLEYQTNQFLLGVQQFFAQRSYPLPLRTIFLLAKDDEIIEEASDEESNDNSMKMDQDKPEEKINIIRKERNPKDINENDNN